METAVEQKEYLELLREKRNQDKVVRNVFTQLRADPSSGITPKAAMVDTTGNGAASVADGFREQMAKILEAT